MSYSKVTVKSMAQANKIRNQVHQNQFEFNTREITYAQIADAVTIIQLKSNVRVQVRGMAQGELDELVKKAGV